jgi:putative membrane protein
LIEKAWKEFGPVGKEQNFWYRLASGFVIGLGMVIPGVSGGVLAMVLGLYEPIVAAVGNPFKDWRDNIRLLLPLGIGAAVCLLFLARVLEYLFAQHTLPVLYFFFGLVLAGLPSMVKMANREGFRLSYLVSVVVGVIVLLAATNLPRYLDQGSPGSLSVLNSCFQGVVLGIGLVIPGLSASFLLIAFGFYEALLRALVQMDLSVLVPVGMGALPTVVLVSKVMHGLFRERRGLISHVILGLMLASLWVVFPGWPRTSFEFVLCLALFVGGVGIATLFIQKQVVEK